jgi:hypothetical protein
MNRRHQETSRKADHGQERSLTSQAAIFNKQE